VTARRVVALVPPDRILAEIGRTTAIKMFLTELAGVPRDVIVRALGNLSGPLPARQIRLEAGATVEVEIDVAIPHGMPPGQHDFLFEVVDRDTGSVIDSLEASVDVQHTKAVRMHVSPASIRRRRRGRIRIIVRNHDDETQHIRLRAETDDHETQVTLESPEVSVRPGELVRVSGKVKAKAFYIGKQKERWYSVIGDGAGTPIYTRGNVRQLPMIGKNIKSVMVLLTILMVWAGSTLAVIRLVSPATSEVTAGATAGPADPGDGGDQDGAGAAGAEPILVDVTGTVTAVPDGSGVVVSWRGVSLGDGATEGKVAAGTAESSPDVALQQTETDETGAFVVAGVDALGLYEFSFFKAGHQTKTIIVQPNGQPVTLEVALEAGTGFIGGSTVDPSGAPLGGVDVTLTDGAITYSLSTPTSGDSAGRFSFANLSSPATYVLDAKIAGRGLASTTIELGTGQSIGDVQLVLSPDVATLAGKITAAAFESGSTAAADFRVAQETAGSFGPTFTITATDGTLTRSTTTLTEGLLAGTFRLEQLPVGRTYTITYEAPGFQTLTEQIEFTIDTPEREISMLRSTGRLRGKVTIDGSTLSPAAVAVTVTNSENTYKTTDAITSTGSLLIDGIAPGAYVVIFEALGLEDQVREVDIGAGTSTEVNVTLAATRVSAVKSSLSFKVLKGGNDTTTTVSATVKFRGDGDCGAVDADTDCTYDVNLADGNLKITDLEAGGYVIDFTATGFAPRRIAAQVAASTDAPQQEVVMIPLGSLQGLVADDTSAPIQGLQLSLFLGTTLIGSTTTSANGEFLFSRKLLPETYTIKVTGAGFLPVERSVVGALAATLNLDVTVRGKSLITGEVRNLDLLTGNFQAVEASKFTVYFRQNLAPSNGEWIDAATLGLAKGLGGYRLAVEPNKDPDATPPVNGPVIDICVVATIETATASAFTPTACDTSVPGLSARTSTGIEIELDETVTRSFYFSPTPGEVDGKVTIGGVAEAGVKVEARRVDSDGRVLESSSTLTDADGLFSFNALTPVRPTPADGVYTRETDCTFTDGTCWVIRASEEGTGFADSNLLTIYPGRVLSITTSAINIVKAGGTYNVTFTDDRGSPLVGVNALIYPKSSPPASAWNGSCPGPTGTTCQSSTVSATTISFTGLDPREYTIEARLADYRPFTATVTITQGGAVDQIHKLSATKGGLIIDVRTIAGVSIIGAGVTVSGTAPPLACTTGDDGTCQIDGIDEGVRTLVVSADGYANTNVVATVIGGQTIGTAAVVGSSSGSLYMSVVSSTGDSIANVTFSATVGSETFPCVDGLAPDVADGACLLEGLSAGVRATVTASATNYRSVSGSIGIGSGSSAITLVMTPARSATFDVTTGGEALQGATVTATDSTGRTVSCTDGTLPDPSLNGSCAIDNLALGPVSLVVSRVGYETRTLSVSMTTSSPTFTIELFPATAIALRGRITSNGSPVNGATVEISRGAFQESTTSDSNGDYLFTSLASGSWDVTVSATGYVTTSRTGDQAIRVVTGVITTQDFVLAPSNGQLTFTVQTSGGTPIQGIEVTVSAGSFSSSTTSAVSGLVSFTGLEPGVYAVTVTDSQSPPRFAPQSFVVNVERGYTTTLPIHMGSTKSVVVIGVAGIPAVGFGPQTPLAVEVGLVSGATVVATESAVVGFDRSIATFTEVPDGTYTVTIDGVSGTTVSAGGVTYDVPAKTITTSGPATFDAGLLLLPATKVALNLTVDAGTDDSGVSVTLSDGYLLAPSTSATNGSGVASFAGVPPGTYALRLSKPGVGTIDTTLTVTDASANGGTQNASVDMTSIAPRGIEIQTRSGTEIVAGAYVRVIDDNIGCTTDSTGSCQLFLTPGVVTLSASHPDFETIESPLDISTAPSTIQISFTTPESSLARGSVTFQVETSSNADIDGAEVGLVGDGSKSCTTSSGECTISDLDSTTQTFRISADEFSSAFLTVRPLPGVTISATVELSAVSTSATVTFRTINALTGNSLNGVRIDNVDDPDDPELICTTSSGTCSTATDIDFGMLSFLATKDGFVTTSATVTIDENASTIVVALQPNTSDVSVTVKDDASPHSLLTGVLVESHHGSTCTTSDGTCSIPNLPSGAVTLTFTRANHESKTVVVGLVPGRTTSVAVTLRRTASLTVHVSPSPSTAATFAVVGHGTLCTILTTQTHCTGSGVPFGTWLVSGNGYANSSVEITSSTHAVTMSASP
jgi:hypothetical protein